MGDAYKCIATRSAAIPSNAVRGAQCLAGLLQSPSQKGDALHKRNLTDDDVPNAAKQVDELGAARAPDPQRVTKSAAEARAEQLRLCAQQEQREQEQERQAVANAIAAARRKGVELKKKAELRAQLLSPTAAMASNNTLSPRESRFMWHQKCAVS